jgi:hypothetical protein
VTAASDTLRPHCGVSASVDNGNATCCKACARFARARAYTGAHACAHAGDVRRRRLVGTL